VSIDRAVDINFLLPIPKSFEKLVDYSLYYNIEPSPCHKSDIVYEIIDLTDNHISLNNVSYICNAVILDVLEHSDDQAYVNLIAYLISSTGEEFEARMYLYVNIEENLEETFLNSFQIKSQISNRKNVHSIPGDTIPITQLTIDKFVQYPIWEFSYDEETIDFQDETWVKPAKTKNFTEELNGSIVLGELTTNNGDIIPMMCSLDIGDEEVAISSVVCYNGKQDEYYALEDIVLKIDLPLSINISLTINGKSQSLKFSINKVDIYKNKIRTNFN
jgi:uncharacterized protein YpmS